MKVSIITVCYNSDKYLQDTIDSVLAQDYPNIEYILVDGASTDDTIAIVKRNEARFNGRMKWILEPDNGLYDAMNKGIKMATGDVVGTLNSDDFFTSNTVISEVVKAFSENDVEAIYGDIHFVNPANLNKCVRYYSSRIFRPALLRFGFMPAHPSFYLKKESFTKYGCYSLDYKIAADFDLIARFFYLHKISYKYIKLDFVTMRTGGESANRWLLNKETVRACRNNGIYTNMFILPLKYLYKVFELIKKK